MKENNLYTDNDREDSKETFTCKVMSGIIYTIKDEKFIFINNTASFLFQLLPLGALGGPRTEVDQNRCK